MALRVTTRKKPPGSGSPGANLGPHRVGTSVGACYKNTVYCGLGQLELMQVDCDGHGRIDKWRRMGIQVESAG